MPEVEKRELERAGPAAPVRRRSGFEVLALTWLGLLSASFGASVAFLFPQDGWFGRTIGGAGPVRPAYVVGAAAAIVLFVVLRKLFQGRLDWVKADQGRWVRIVAYVATLALGFFAAVSLYRVPELDSSWWRVLWEPAEPILGKKPTLRPILFPSALVAFAAGAAIHYLYGRPKWADFLIETEGELRKVSWPLRKEWVGSSIVVIVLVAAVACFLWASDEFLTWVMLKTNLGF